MVHLQGRRPPTATVDGESVTFQEEEFTSVPSSASKLAATVTEVEKL
jgi:hypothetical protein